MGDESWLELLNSDWHDYRGSGRREDRLDNPEWRGRFLAVWKADLAGVPESEQAAGLRRLRDAIRRLVDAYTTGRPVRLGDWAELNGILDGNPCVRRMEHAPGRPRLQMVPVRRGLPAVLAEIAGSFAEAVSGGDPARIKTCQNQDCGWTFYDRTKNRSQKWCEDTCGNLIKVRRFRSKQSHESNERPSSRNPESKN